MAIQIPSQQTRANVGRVVLEGTQKTGAEFGVSALGEAGQAVGSVMMQQAQRQQQQANLAEVQGGENGLYEFINNATYGEGGLYSKKGKDSIEASSKFMSDLDAKITEQSNSLSNDQQKAVFAATSQKMRTRAQMDSLRYQQQQVTAYKAQQQDSYLSNSQVAAARSFGDPERVEELVGDQVDSIRAYGNANGLPAETVQMQVYDAKAKTYGGVVDQLINEGRYQDASSFMKEREQDVTPDFFDKANSAIESKRQQAIKLANQAMSEQREKAFVNLSLKQIDGTLTNEVLDAAYNDGDGLLSGQQYVTFKKAIATQTENYDRVTESLLSGVPLDPADNSKDGDVQSVETYYKTASKSWSKEDYQSNLLGLVKQTGIVPPSIVSNVRGSIRSGDPSQAYQAADLIEKVRIFSPKSTGDFDSNDLSFARQVTSLVSAGVPQDKAIETVTKNVYQTSEVEKAQYQAAFDKKERGNSQGFLDKRIDKEIDEFWFKAQPDVPPAMTGEFDMITKSYLNTTGGDVEAARDLAWSDMRRVWGGTEIGPMGQQMFKYSPEVIYGNGYGKSDWVTNQFKSETSSLKEPFITSDTKTARDKYPSYPIMHKDENGRVVPYIVDGVPQRWKPDFKQTEEYQTIQKEKEDALNRGVESREYKLSGRELEDQEQAYVQSRAGGTFY